jgi:hypothetical protein
MQNNLSPYLPIPQELASSGMLISIKQAAVDEEACESTLKANAKSHRLPAYQSHFGAPVMVIPGEVREFLKSRPDIASKYHPKVSPAVSAAGVTSTTATLKARDDFHFPNGDGTCGAVGDFGIGITLHSLSHTTPSERGLVAKCLMEVARQINETIPASAGNQPQH